jgi:hypothetical protein
LLENKERTDEKEWFYKLIDDRKWIKEHDAHFKRNCKELYDLENFERMKRFANAPMDYIDERIELNKDVTKGYHKLHTSILLTGLLGFYLFLLGQTLTSFLNTFKITSVNSTYQISNIDIPISVFLLILFIVPFIAIKINLKFRIMRWIGLLTVIRDSEIEIYYLAKIKEYRNSIECPKCHERVPKDSDVCYYCGKKL